MFPFPNVQGGRSAPQGPQTKFSRTDRSLGVTTLSESDRRLAFPSTSRGGRNNKPALTSGKFFAEFEVLAGPNTQAGVGFCQTSFSLASIPGTAGSVAYRNNGLILANNVSVMTASALSVGDKVGIAINIASGRYWMSRNGAWLWGDPATETGGALNPLSEAMQLFVGSGTSVASDFRLNEQSTYPCPTGFLYWPIGIVESNWDPERKTIGVELSQNDQRALTSYATWSQVQGKGPKSTGKWWIDFSMIYNDAETNGAIGISRGSVGEALLGLSADEVGLRFTDGGLLTQGGFINSYGDMASGILRFAVDFDAQRFWIYRDLTGFWLNPGGNPNAGGPGFAFSKGSEPWRPAASIYSNAGTNGGVFLNPASAFSMPAGFSYWNDN